MAFSLIRRRSETDEEQPISVGAYGTEAVLPVFDLRTLARLDAMGELAWSRMRGRRAEKRIRKAFEKQSHHLEIALGKETRSRREQLRPERETDPLADMPRSHRISDRVGFGFGFGDVDSSMTGWHNATIPASGVLIPYVAGGRTRFDGPIIGVETRSGLPFRFDAWSSYRKHEVGSPNAIIAGMLSSGKSMLLKILALRHIQEGRRVLIEGDPKGEWKKLCHALGGTVVSIGPDSRLNLLDVGDKPDSLTESAWAVEALSLRSVAAKSVVSALRPGQPLSMGEDAVLTAALTELSAGPVVPTISRLVDLLDSDWTESARVRGMDPSQRREAGNSLILVFNHLVTGELRDAFETESTERIDPSSPMIVFDTGSADESNPTRKAVFTAAMSAGLERVCASRDGVFRLVIAEEGHELLKNPELVTRWDKRVRLSGELSISNFLLIHELTDLEKYASTEALRKLMEGIISLSEIKILFRQSPSSLPKLDLILQDLTEQEKATVATLENGVALWRVGSVRTLVRAIPSAALFKIIDTRKGRQG